MTRHLVGLQPAELQGSPDSSGSWAAPGGQGVSPTQMQVGAGPAGRRETSKLPGRCVGSCANVREAVCPRQGQPAPQSLSFNV